MNSHALSAPTFPPAVFAERAPGTTLLALSFAVNTRGSRVRRFLDSICEGTRSWFLIFSLIGAARPFGTMGTYCINWLTIPARDGRISVGLWTTCRAHQVEIVPAI
jgi:hypothetical protein